MKFNKILTSLIFFGTILIPLSLMAQVNGPSNSQKGIIKGVKQYANLRVAPKIKGPIILQVPLGSQVEILEIKIPSQDTGKWKARYPLWVRARFQGKVGFIAGSLVSMAIPAGSAVLKVKYDPSLPYQEMAPSLFQPKQILLTFDDGPRIGVTDALLDLLKKYRVQGIFFVNGYAIRLARKNGGTALIQRMDKEGHIIGNHTDRHKTLTGIDGTERDREIQDCTAEIQKEFSSFGKTWKPLIFRFPSGAYKHQTGADLRKEIHGKYKMVICAPTRIHGQDWQNDKKSDFIFKKLKETTLSQGRGILILHELSKSMEALKKYIPWALNQGYTFVRLNVQGPSSTTPQLPSQPLLPSVNIAYSLKKTQYHHLYYKWGKHYGIDWRLLKAIAIVESSERPHLVNKFGYTGLFQIGDSVLQGFNKKAGTNWTKASLVDPERNTRIGAWLTSRNIKVLSRPEVFGTQFLSDPVNLAVAVYCSHNYGIGLVKKTVEAHRTQKKPMTFQKVFDAVEEAGKNRYGNKAGEAKMKVAKKVGAYYIALRQKLGSKP